MSDVGQRGSARPMRIDVPRPLDLTLAIASDVAHPYTPLSVDIARPTYDLSVPTASNVAYTLPPGNVDVAGPAYGPARLLISTLRVHLAHRRLMCLGLLALVFIGLCPLWACVNLSRRCR